MSQSDNNSIGATLSPDDISKGHGKFPYVIVRMHHGIYMQMPIHFISEKKEGLNGIMVKSEATNHLDNFPYLIRIASDYKRNLEMKNKAETKLCLVVAEYHAYYFSENEIRFSTSIPTGGTLVNAQQLIIAMGAPHFIQSSNPLQS
jgi:hypothetical protein